MRTLVYAMQSSGASLFTYWLAQQDDHIAILDLYCDQIAPFIDFKNVIIKCTIAENVSLEMHKKAFQPDKTILFVRNPIENYLSLCEKAYADKGGSIETKMQILDECINSNSFDNVIKYEDFIMKKNLNIGDKSNYKFKRSLEQIIKYNNDNSQWCKLNYRKKWGIGNIHANNLDVFNIEKFAKIWYFYNNE